MGYSTDYTNGYHFVHGNLSYDNTGASPSQSSLSYDYTGASPSQSSLSYDYTGASPSQSSLPYVNNPTLGSTLQYTPLFETGAGLNSNLQYTSNLPNFSFQNYGFGLPKWNTQPLNLDFSKWQIQQPLFNCFNPQLTAPNISFAAFNSTPCFTIGDTFTYTNNHEPIKNSKPREDGDFDKMISYILKIEGGYNPDDCGQAGNMGVQQGTYNTYRRRKGLPKQDVKNITREEAIDLYYTMFYKESGADKIQDPKLAMRVLDVAINSGVSAAKKMLKKSGNSIEKFDQLRIEKYRSIAHNDKSKSKYLNGWEKRVANVRTYTEETFSA